MAHYTVNEIAAKYRRHPVTVRRALATGTLYGIQRVPRGKWIITEADAEAWINGETDQAQAS